MHTQSAVVVIDVQTALCSGENACFKSDKVISTINTVIDKARTTQTPIIFIQHETETGEFVPQSSGWQLSSELDIQPTDVCVSKTASDAFHQTKLQEVLSSLGVNDLIICGMQSEFCVDSTIRRALALGYTTRVVADGHTTVDNDVLPAAKISAHHNHTWQNISSYPAQATVLAAQDIHL